MDSYCVSFSFVVLGQFQDKTNRFSGQSEKTVALNITVVRSSGDLRPVGLQDLLLIVTTEEFWTAQKTFSQVDVKRWRRALSRARSHTRCCSGLSVLRALCAQLNVVLWWTGCLTLAAHAHSHAHAHTNTHTQLFTHMHKAAHTHTSNSHHLRKRAVMAKYLVCALSASVCAAQRRPKVLPSPSG